MKKVALCFWLNVCLFFAFISLAFTGAVLKWILPSHQGRGWQGGRGLIDGLEGGASKWFLGMHRSGWTEIHFAIALALILLVLIHLALHWNWVVCSVKSRIFSTTEN